jgi:pimeloyl-ACP methyl ester carboxylesterase
LATQTNGENAHGLHWQISADPKIAQVYARVPADQLQRLIQFRAAHPYTETTIDGIPWRYIAAGDGPQTALLLTGALGTVESSWQTLAAFSQRPDLSQFRLIAPDYPPQVATMAALTDGIARILDHTGIDRAHVLGGSFGGYVAQVFARRHLERTGKLVISAAGPPNPERGQAINKALRWLRLLPMPILRAILNRRLAGLLSGDHPELAITHAHVQEVVGSLMTKDGLLNGFRRAADFDLNYGSAPGAATPGPPDILLLMAEEDPSTPPGVREALQALYPHAQVHLFTGASHAMAILRQEEYLSAIASFLDNQGPPG